MLCPFTRPFLTYTLRSRAPNPNKRRANDEGDAPIPNRCQIAGSILGGNPLDLAGAIRTCELARVDLLQLDICDGSFVPSISFGESVVKAACQSTNIPVEVHLMVVRPEIWITRMQFPGVFRMIFHLEASARSMGVVQSIAAAGMKPAIAINPETPAVAVEPLLPYIDNVCIMGIPPGFAGQTLLDYTYRKIADVRALIGKTASPATITVDGGVKSQNAKKLVDAGADILVLSSGIYSHPNPAESINEVHRAVAAS